MLNFETILLILIAILLLGWPVWFLVEFVRYVASGDYDVDRRLRELRR